MSRRTRRADQLLQRPAHSTTVSNNPIFFVHDGLDDLPVAAVAKPLPLPPSRAHQPAGSRRAAASPFVTSQRGSGWVLRRVHHHDPFLAAYVACTKNGGGGGKVDAAAPAKRQQEKNRSIGDAVQGCGIWSGWAAAGAKYAGVMSCKYGCDVAAVQGGDPAASPAPRLHLSRQLVVIPARWRALQARKRPQG